MKTIINIQKCFLVAVFLASFNLAYSQDSIKIVELNTQRTIRQLIGKASTESIDSQDIVTSLGELSLTTTQLYSKIKNDDNFDFESDSLFYRSLKNSQGKLEKLMENWVSNSHAKLIIDAVQKDYFIKTNTSALGGNSNVITRIEVSVFTKKGNLEIDGYNVKCNYLWDYQDKEAKFIFNNQTNNAIMKLSPGYYIIWVEKNGEIIQSKDKVEIGNLQLSEEFIIFNL